MVIEEPRPKKRATIITWLIIAICVIVFIITLDPTGLVLDEKSALVQSLWYKTDLVLLQGKNLHTLVTSAFLHGDWFHIIGNMYFLYVFGDDTEDIMGRIPFIVFYIFAAVIASLFFGIVNIIAFNFTLDPLLLSTPAVGASGAIFGILAAYAIFLPNRTLVIPGWGRVPAKFYILIYAVMETIYIFSSGDNVAHAAHVGGFLGGVLFVFVFKKYMSQQLQHAKTVYLPASLPKIKKS